MADFSDKPVFILGAGGIGTALAWSLTRSGYPVTLVDANPLKVAEGQKNGISVDGYETLQIPIITFKEWVAPPESFTLLCTKTYDNSVILARLPTSTFVVPIQNGFDPELELRDHGCEGIASFVSECQRDCPVTRITRPGSLHIGSRRSLTDDECSNLASLAAALGAAKLFTVECVEDIRPYKATKLLYNAAISPLAAMAGVDNGELLSDQLAKALFFALLLENYAILRHAKIPLARIGPFHPDTVSLILRTPWLPALMAMFFRPSLHGTYCSMAPDFLINQGRTEIDAYTGHLIRLAGDFPCPLNRAVLSLVGKVTGEGLKPQRKFLQHLAESLPKGILH
ncbi:2-dehydropantoate 2-reductase N-terminal domain-containing protein [Nitrosomonas sp.]|uniref:ketopantoate reductase family protein n=2 Tax=Nitrosomonas sp. TaxID=42353 RepID=UPI001DDE089F|nr:2-dehydropantoate 2-reductase N-terminal domain-containing protein [Nitrosomonas sp.]MCB1950044.1 ketopantoate reductase family protein [Nitrosomonas sp.]